jgi:hypothetical protein
MRFAGVQSRASQRYIKVYSPMLFRLLATGDRNPSPLWRRRLHDKEIRHDETNFWTIDPHGHDVGNAVDSGGPSATC